MKGKNATMRDALAYASDAEILARIDSAMDKAHGFDWPTFRAWYPLLARELRALDNERVRRNLLFSAR